jgi:hypothetical protein
MRSVVQSPRSHRTRWLTAALSGLLLAAVPRAAHADASTCVGLHTSGQREVKAGHPKLAAEQFMTCGSDETCPETVRTDCMTRYEAAQRLIPTVIFSVVDEQGSDVTGVQVHLGEEVLARELDGRAVALEPGRHSFRFALPWSEEVTHEVLLREGEQNRVVTLKVKRPGGAAAAAGSVPSADASGTLAPGVPEEKSSSLSPAFWVASGVGVVALGSFATFGLLGRNKHQDLADCSPSCAASRRSEYDDAKRNYLIADISLGVAAVSLGVATYLLISSGGDDTPSADSARARKKQPFVSSARLSVVPVTSGAGLMLTGTSF